MLVLIYTRIEMEGIGHIVVGYSATNGSIRIGRITRRAHYNQVVGIFTNYRYHLIGVAFNG